MIDMISDQDQITVSLANQFYPQHGSINNLKYNENRRIQRLKEILYINQIFKYKQKIN